MATLGGITIADKTSSFHSGAGFLLAQKCKFSNKIILPSRAEVEVCKDNPYVVARVKGVLNSKDVFKTCYETAQQGLDLIVIQRGARLSTRNASEDCLLWWRESSKQILRIISIDPLNVSTECADTVHDARGNLVPLPPAPPIIYHECFRYIRLSEVSDDLFEAFRNMYLGFEGLLASIVPIKSKERESCWLNRSLRKLNNEVSLSAAFGTTIEIFTDEFIQEIYKAVRCALFHAKKSVRLNPHRLIDRTKVSKALLKLSNIVFLIVAHYFHARRPSGGLTDAGFGLMAEKVFRDSEIIISDESEPFLFPLDKFKKKFLEKSVTLRTRFAPELSEPGLFSILGEVDAKRLDSLRELASCALKRANQPLLFYGLDAVLQHTNIDKLEVQMGLRLNNTHEQRVHFNT